MTKNNLIKKSMNISLFYGIGLVILSVIVALNPESSLAFVFKIYGIYLLISGVTTISQRGELPKNIKYFSIFSGIISIISGLFVFIHPSLVAGITTGFILYMLAFVLVIKGFADWKPSKSLSLFNILSGLILILFTKIALITLIWIITGLFLITGLTIILMSQHVKKSLK